MCFRSAPTTKLFLLTVARIIRRENSRGQDFKVVPLKRLFLESTLSRDRRILMCAKTTTDS